MEDRMYKVFSPNDSKVAMKVIPGHFVTTHSHITHYVDMTDVALQDRMKRKLLQEFWQVNMPIIPRWTVSSV